MQLVHTIYGQLIYAPKGRVPKKVRKELASGMYEQDEAQILPAVLHPELPLVELGAGIGVVSCFANQLLKDPAAHVAVEMHPDVIGILEINRAMNRASFQIENRTIGYDGRPAATTGGESWQPGFRLGPDARPACSLQSLVEERDWGEFNLVMDIEGAELMLLENEFELIARQARSVSLEVHPHVLGVTGAARVVRLLTDAGLELVALGEGSVLGFRRAGCDVS
jgi:FkbM family methyltransferase